MKCRWIMAAIMALSLGGTAQAQYLLNGNFETTWVTTNSPADWTKSGSGAFSQTSPNQRISGTYSLRLVASNPSSLSQDLLNPGSTLTKWSVGFDLAASDPGGATDRSFDLVIRHGATGVVRLRLVDADLDGDGDIQTLSGASTWTTRVADAVEFTTGNATTGAITLAGAINHLEIVGDYSASPTYQIFVTSDLGSKSSAVLTDFGTAAPATGSWITQVSFIGNNYAANSFAVVDNLVVVPEPAGASLVIAGLGAWGLMRRRRV